MEYLPTILVGVVVLALAALAVRSLWNNHKRGGGCVGCSGGCTHCNGNCTEHTR